MSVASVQVRSVLDCNLHPVHPSFADPASSQQSAGESTQGSAQASSGIHNMSRPLMADVGRYRQQRFEEVSAHLEDVGPWRLGTGSASASLFLRTLPFAHILLQATRGEHLALQRLPFPFMTLIMKLQDNHDGDILRS